MARMRMSRKNRNHESMSGEVLYMDNGAVQYCGTAPKNTPQNAQQDIDNP